MAFKRDRERKIKQQERLIKPYKDHHHGVCGGDYDEEDGTEFEHHHQHHQVDDDDDDNHHENSHKLTTCNTRTITAVPIDHALSLPSISNLSTIRFGWLSNDAVTREPFSKTNLDLIQEINIVGDAIKLHQVGIQPQSILASICSTLVLKHCALVEGLMLCDIGELFVRDLYTAPNIPSPFENIVMIATRNADGVFSNLVDGQMPELQLVQRLEYFLEEVLSCLKRYLQTKGLLPKPAGYYTRQARQYDD